MSKLKCVLFCVPALFFAGCVTPPPQKYEQKTSQFDHSDYSMASCTNWLNNIPPKEKQDKLLWEDRLSVDALQQGDWVLATHTLDDVVTTLGGIRADDPQARKARSFFHAESSKNYIGEPYERCAAYFLRGLIYWRDGELDNARACFRSVEFEDSYTETIDQGSGGAGKSLRNQKPANVDTVKTNYSGDWVLPDYLDALATAKLGGDGSDALKRAQTHDRYLALPAFNTNANVLLVFGTGRGPIKYSTGQYHDELRFVSGNAVVQQTYLGNRLVNKYVHDTPSSHFPLIKIGVSGISETVTQADDLYFQASTRGGRLMDHINANKVTFKNGANTVGDIALMGAVAAGMVSLNNNNSSGAGIAALGFLAIGITAKIIAAETTPAADTRTWDNLPGYFALATLQLPPGGQQLHVELLDPAGGIISKKDVNFTVADGNKDTVVFVDDNETN